jgi:hypothetical protein
MTFVNTCDGEFDSQSCFVLDLQLHFCSFISFRIISWSIWLISCPLANHFCKAQSHFAKSMRISSKFLLFTLPKSISKWRHGIRENCWFINRLINIFMLSPHLTQNSSLINSHPTIFPPSCPIEKIHPTIFPPSSPIEKICHWISHGYSPDSILVFDRHSIPKSWDHCNTHTFVFRMLSINVNNSSLLPNSPPLAPFQENSNWTKVHPSWTDWEWESWRADLDNIPVIVCFRQ